jgi:2-oxoglutarate ferredoxin oxidoreductase subunit beta
MVPLIKAAIHHKGFAFINVISPCVTFNNNPGSTKSYDYVREHIEATSTVDFVPHKPEIKAFYDEGTDTLVSMHDGSYLHLHKLAKDWDPRNRISAANALQQARARGEILTGLLYVNTEFNELHTTLNTSRTPLNKLTEKELCPGSAALADINEGLR